MKSSFKLGHIAGIEIGVHYTWVFAFILIAWSLAQGLFPSTILGLSVSTYWIMGVLASIFLFASVLLHELAHSLVAQARGMKVGSITLFIFGGVSNLQGEPETARTEFVMAIVGPMTSLALGGIFYAVGLTVGVGGNLLGPQPSAVAAMLAYLSWINLILGVFNLIPGFPLDGGRVLCSIIWGKTRNLVKSTNIAASVGRYFGWALIAYGLYGVLFTRDFLGGLWIAFIGWFLSSAADASRREITLQEQLGGVLVKEVMDANPVIASPGTTVEQVVNDMFLQKGCRAVPIASDRRLLGIVTINDVKRLERDKWPLTTVDAIMTREPIYSVTPDEDLGKAMKLIAEHGLNQLPVVQDGKLTGLVCRADIIRHLQISQELGARPRPRKDRPR